MKQTARVVVNGKVSNNNSKVTIDDETYDLDLSNHVENLISTEQLNLENEEYLILVPHTISKEKDTILNDLKDKEQKPYLRFTLIGVPKNQDTLLLDEVNIKGKCIYENVNHEFVLIKIEFSANQYDIIKLNGILQDTYYNGKGNAREKLFIIKAYIVGKSLYIQEDKCLSKGTQIAYMSKYRDFKQNYKVA